MIRIKIITLGKLKEKYLREAETEYLKRIEEVKKFEENILYKLSQRANMTKNNKMVR